MDVLDREQVASTASMTPASRSLLEEARDRFPRVSDVTRMELIAAEIIEILDEHPPVALEVVASYRDIGYVRVEPLPFAGSLTPEAEGLVMRLNIRDGSRRRRFSGFHEVAHTFQPGYRHKMQFRCHPRQLETRGTSDPEGLCDAAAAELLLPRRDFLPDLFAAGFGWAAVGELADYYQASLLATALRTVRFATDPTMLVVLEPRLRKNERGHAEAKPRLRVVTTATNGRFPFVPPNKSASDDGALTRAWAGEVVDEVSSLTDLGLTDAGALHLSARLFPYAGAEGEVRRVMALYRQPSQGLR